MRNSLTLIGTHQVTSQNVGGGGGKTHWLALINRDSVATHRFNPFNPGPFRVMTFSYRGASCGHVGQIIFQKDPLEADLWPFL